MSNYVPSWHFVERTGGFNGDFMFMRDQFLKNNQRRYELYETKSSLKIGLINKAGCFDIETC
jgi:hypothetical protein